MSPEARLAQARRKIEKELKTRVGSSDPERWLKLAQVLIQQGEIKRMRRCVDKAISLSKSAPQITYQASQILVSCDLKREAFELAKKTLGLHPNSPVLASSFGGLADKINEAEQGLTAIEALSSENLKNPNVQLVHAMLLRKAGDLERGWTILDPLTQNESSYANSTWKINLWDEVFRYLDKREEYEKAFEALQRRKEINLANIQPDKAEMQRKHKEESYRKMLAIIEELDDETLARWREEANSEETPAFLLGHPRSGTTLLENVLESHSQLTSSDERPSFQVHVISGIQNGFQPTVDDETTPRLFVDYLTNYPEKSLHSARHTYLKEMQERLGIINNQIVTLDKNPAITDGMVLVHRLFPAAKIVYALRDPRAVVWSAFTLPMVGSSWIGSFWNTLEDSAIAYGYLSDIWEAFKAKLPESQYIEARYEDTVEDVAVQGRAVTEFLGLEWEESQAKFYEHAQSKVVRSPTYADVAKPIYTRAREHWKNYAQFMEPAIEHLAPYLDRLGYEK